jgi:hypothetical protein
MTTATWDNPIKPIKMKQISKTYKTLAAAERYQNRLYGQYNIVRLIHYPLMSEDGLYIWNVGGPIARK